MQAKIIADENTGVIRCTECGDTIQGPKYDGSILTFIALDRATDEMVTRHAARHGWQPIPDIHEYTRDSDTRS